MLGGTKVSLLERIYDRSPIFMQNLMATIEGYRKNHSRYGKIYREHRAFLREFDGWDIAKKNQYQLDRMKDIISHAYRNSPFYGRLYRNIDIESIQTIEDLKRLPILDKETLRENIDSVITLPKNKALKHSTGGTTGKSMTVYSRRQDMMKFMAVLDNFKARVGFDHRRMKRATFNGKHIVPPGQKSKVFWRYNAACKQMIYSSFHLAEENMKYYIDSLNKYKPMAIDGFFMSMLDIANYMERHGLKPEFTPIAIFPTSETLTKDGRELLERVFGCRVYDQYGSSEGAPYVTECESQTLHIEMTTGIIEHYEEGSDEIVVTSFLTYGTPLIRYKIGDAMVFGDDTPCDCKMQSQTIKEIRGRGLEFLYASHGAKMSVANISNIFKVLPNAIIRSQTIQDRPNEITILIETDKNLYKDEYDKILANEFRHKFGDDMSVIIKQVDEIPREKSGKLVMIKNNIDTQKGGSV
ncbi:MAG: hypothetical protein FWH14_03925 [Oscillospiraceae bacterium]|nr:hypothetical protein [Oscillospiraceae bacterium]